MRECPICLEAILATALLGRIKGCLHSYHDHCLNQWSTHSNSCPTCRKLFYGIDIIDGSNPDLIKRSVTVKDKIIENDAINHIPSEFIIPPQIYTEPTTEESDRNQNGVCLICTNSQYSQRNRPMVCCFGCGAKFHTLCLGHHDEPEWFCPLCDCCQEILLPVTARVSYRPTRPARQGLTILNENDEIEDFDDRDQVIRTASVLNGGVLLRREARQLENLTKEEADSWSALEQVRLGTASVPEEAQSLNSASSRKKRRRNRTKPGPSSPKIETLLLIDSSNIMGPSSAADRPSRIVLLMNQIRAGGSTSLPEGHLPRKHNSDDTDNCIYGEDMNPPSPKPLSSASKLSYNQKKKIQKFVRDKLRPRYDPLSVSPDPEIIKSELEYVKINKAISRKVYSEILSLVESKSEKSIEDFFASEESTLQELVNVHADGCYGKYQ